MFHTETKISKMEDLMQSGCIVSKVFNKNNNTQKCDLQGLDLHAFQGRHQEGSLQKQLAWAVNCPPPSVSSP